MPIVRYNITIKTSAADRPDVRFGKAGDAGTDGEVHLRVYYSTGGSDDYKLDNPAENDRELGMTDHYVRLPSKAVEITNTVNEIRRIVLRIEGEKSDDAWLPQQVVVTATMNDGRDVVLNNVAWNADWWLSTDKNDAEGHALPAYEIYPTPRGLALTDPE